MNFLTYSRLSAVSCECGLLKLAKINVNTLEITQNWTLRYDNPVCTVRIFPSQNEIKKPAFLNIEYGKIIFNHKLLVSIILLIHVYLFFQMKKRNSN